MTTPRDQIAIYSTTVTGTTSTSPTVSEIITDVRARLPLSSDTFPDGLLCRLMDQKLREIWRFCAQTKIYAFNTSTAALYAMPADMRIDKIQSVLIADSTAATSTEVYTAYEFCNSDETLTGNQWFDGLDGRFGVYPIQSSDSTGGAYLGKVIYETSPVTPSTTGLSLTLGIDEFAVESVRNHVLKAMAGSGNAPNFEVANYYAAEEAKCDRHLKMEYYKRQQKDPKDKWDYKRGWWKG